jgi:hypothetical protein
VFASSWLRGLNLFFNINLGEMVQSKMIKWIWEKSIDLKYSVCELNVTWDLELIKKIPVDFPPYMLKNMLNAERKGGYCHDQIGWEGGMNDHLARAGINFIQNFF